MKKLHNVAISVLLILSISVISEALSVQNKISEDMMKDFDDGGWTSIKNINEPPVAEIAKFAVTEYNKQSGAKLNWVKIIKGETQVVAGENYRLVLSAKDGSVTKNYEAVVWERLWLHSKELTSFKPLN